MVSKARVDLPEPDGPVTTTSLPRGMVTSTFLRLCSRAPRTTMLSRAIEPAPGVGLAGGGEPAAADGDMVSLRGEGGAIMLSGAPVDACALPREPLPVHRGAGERKKDYDWRNFLPKRKATRGRRSRIGQSSVVPRERASRPTLLHRPENKGAEAVAPAMHPLGVETYFCDIRSRRRIREGVENATGRLRRELPRRTDLNGVSDEELTLPHGRPATTRHVRRWAT